MYNVKNVIDTIVKNSKSNDVNCIPFLRLKRFSKFVPGIMRGTYYCITATTGCGKSRFMRCLFIFDALKYAKENNIKLNILLFSLEETKQKFIMSLILSILYERYKINISYRNLLSIGPNNKVSAYVLECISEIQEEVEELIKDVKIFEDKRTANEIYDTCIRYKDEDESAYNVCIVDHISLLEGSSLKDEIDKWGNNAVLLRNIENFTMVDVQQQALASENLDHFKANKLEPSIQGLGDSKTQSRNYDIILGLFNPSKHEYTTHRKYRILGGLGSYYRSLHVLKDRDGDSNIGLPMFFEGASGQFYELPRHDDPKIDKLYEYVNTNKIDKITKMLTN